MDELQKKLRDAIWIGKSLRDAIWIGKSLFDRNKTSGSSANMSFLHDGKMYITKSGSCFGSLTEERMAAAPLRL